MDIIIVENNEKMQSVIDWTKNNESWLQKFEFKIPFEDGMIDFQEELVNFQ